MGDYHTRADLQARFEDDEAVAHLTDTSDSGTPNTAVLDEVIDGTEGEMNSYIGSKYLIPVAVGDHAQLAAMMKSRALDMSVFHLLERGDVVPEAKRLAYDNAIVWCKAVASGSAVLPTPDTEAGTASRDPVATYGAPDPDSEHRVFTRTTQERL